MSTLIIRLPLAKHSRLKSLAENRKISLNKLIDELATTALANHDVALRFEARARKGRVKRALGILDKLDRQ